MPQLNKTGLKDERKMDKSRTLYRKGTSKTFYSSVSILKELNQTHKQFNQQISRYSQQELECYYHSLIKFSMGDSGRYREGMETMLNLMGVQSNDKVLGKELHKFEKSPSFDRFVGIFAKIVDANLRENVMDFFDIVFEECGVNRLDKG
jgi:hypothetical protein